MSRCPPGQIARLQVPPARRTFQACRCNGLEYPSSSLTTDWHGGLGPQRPAREPRRGPGGLPPFRHDCGPGLPCRRDGGGSAAACTETRGPGTTAPGLQRGTRGPGALAPAPAAARPPLPRPGPCVTVALCGRGMLYGHASCEGRAPGLPRRRPGVAPVPRAGTTAARRGAAGRGLRRAGGRAAGSIDHGACHGAQCTLPGQEVPARLGCGPLKRLVLTAPSPPRGYGHRGMAVSPVQTVTRRLRGGRAGPARSGLSRGALRARAPAPPASPARVVA